MSGLRPNESAVADYPVAVTPEAIREEAERVIADPLFRNSHRSSNLLRFIVDRTLKGQNRDLKERIIGIEVFGRTPDYDTSNDSTVRVVANDVRKRLAQYYAKAEHEHEVRIEIPVRSYIAEFRFPEHSPLKLQTEVPELLAPEPAPAVLQPASEQHAPRRLALRRWYVSVPAAAAILALAVWGVLRFLSPAPVIDRFWAPVLNSSGPVLICIGSPLDENGVPAAPALSIDPATPTTPFYAAEQHVNVGVMDGSAAEQLAAYLRRKGKDSIVSPTQSTQLADFRPGPAVLYGMFLNEWVVKLGADLHFRFGKESDHGLRWIEDTSNPADRKWSLNLSAPYDQIGSDYALITRVRDQSTGRWWIGIAGLTGVGTLAANQAAIDPIMMSIIGAQLPRGWESKNLQIVLEIKVVQGKAGSTRVLTTYTW